LVLLSNEQQLNRAYTILYHERQKYRRNIFKKWICLAIGLTIGLLLSFPMLILFEAIGFSFYNREGLDGALQERFGDAGFSNLNVDELMIAAFEFNSQTPRFFSKYFAHMEPGQYDVPLKTAVGASSSAPVYFDPLQTTNSYNVTGQLVDGGIICNDPALYAYDLATRLSSIGKNKTIRLLSLGTGKEKENDEDLNDPESYSKAKTFSSFL
jgi:patatin-like phospholipase/acyl hydrolase